MRVPILRVALAQTEIHWQNAEANFTAIEAMLSKADPFHLCVLPEMFATGFTMTPSVLSDTIGEDSSEFLRKQSALRSVGFCGSTPYKISSREYVNRCQFACDGQLTASYDKFHLFTLAGEHEAYVRGDSAPEIVEFRGWRILLQVCYDLRFPVYSSNVDNRYDLAIYVANWPQARRDHWLCLLKARAIENQAYVIGVNRVGTDGNELQYVGDSCAFSASGEQLLHLDDEEQIGYVDFDFEKLDEYRKKLPFIEDADQFELKPISEPAILKAR